MSVYDFQRDFLCKKFEGMSSTLIRATLTANEGRNDLAQLVIARAGRKLEHARREFFLKPVITLPFSVSKKTLKKAYQKEDGFREVMYRSKQSCLDEAFQYRNFVTNHWLLRKVINESIFDQQNVAAVDCQIICDGIRTYDYAVTQRTIVPFHVYESGEKEPNLPIINLVNLFGSVRVIDDILHDFIVENETVGNYIVTPYTDNMWNSSKGYSSAGGYRFAWQDSKLTDVPFQAFYKLTESFFTSAAYRSFVLRIQPYNSDKVLTITRTQFLKLFGPAYYNGKKHTIIRRVGGFVVLDFSIVPIIDLTKVSVFNINESLLTKGYTYVPPSCNFVSTQWDMRNITLANLNGYYLEPGLIDTIKRVILLTEVTQDLVQHIMLHIMSFTSKVIIVNNVVLNAHYISPELLCQLLEHLLPEILYIRSRLLKIKIEKKLKKVSNLAELESKTFQLILNFQVGKASSAIDNMGKFESELCSNAMKYKNSPQMMFSDTVNQSHIMSSKRKEYMSEILTKMEALFPTAPYYTTKLLRKPVSGAYYATAITRIKDSLVLNNKYTVSIELLQSIYDNLFPGNSTLNYTALQMQGEVESKAIILAVPYFRVSYSRIYSDKSERLIIPSRLRTSTSADLAGSFLDMMGALMKRNFNRQAAEVPGNKKSFVNTCIIRVLNTYGVPMWKELLGHFKLMPITPGLEALRLWADKHSESDVKAAAAILSKSIADPAKYNAMPKAQTKPILDLTAQGSIAVGQTVVFHSKDIIALSVGIFTLILERLLLLFPNSIRFAFGADEHTVGQWADTYLNLPGTFVYEFDVPKFDKSQDQTCFTLILEVMRLVGVSDDFIKYWERASFTANVFNTQFSMVFTLFYGNRSGSGGTLAVNCICLLFAFYSEFANLNIVGTLIKGDDSVMVTRAEITDDHVTRLLDRWGFTLKRREVRQYVSFCSSIFVKTSNDSYALLRDPVRLLTKLGRGLSPEREAAYFIDYYVSFVDATCQYEDEVALNNLKLAVFSLYNKTVDVDSIIQFLRQIVVSYKVFLKTLYGFNDETLKEVSKLDTPAEILTYAKQQGFIKSKMLTDICPTLKLPLIEKIRSYTSEMLFDNKYSTNTKLELKEDKTDILGWVHSI